MKRPSEMKAGKRREKMKGMQRKEPKRMERRSEIDWIIEMEDNAPAAYPK